MAGWHGRRGSGVRVRRVADRLGAPHHRPRRTSPGQGATDADDHRPRRARRACRRRGSSAAACAGSPRASWRLDAERWAVRMRDERGYHKQLPDLAVWRRGADAAGRDHRREGHRREDRQRLILEGWRDAVLVRTLHRRPIRLRQRAGRRADGAPGQEGPLHTPGVHRQGAGWSRRDRQRSPRQPNSKTPPRPRGGFAKGGTADGLDGRQLQLIPQPAPSTAIKREPPPPPERDESPEAVAERERLYREIMGIPDPKPRRLWRR